jgi:hypothetical protein
MTNLSLVRQKFNQALTLTESIFCLFNLLEDILVFKSHSRLRQSLINITTIFLRSVNKVYVVLFKQCIFEGLLQIFYNENQAYNEENFKPKQRFYYSKLT